jgi:RNA:NAD 2'-phosphotransferase (TPT1/KptA family)
MLYHATPVSTATQILTNGLRPKNNEIYLSPTPEDAVYAASQWHGDSEFAVLSVNVNDFAFDGVEADGRENTRFITRRSVPANRIKFLKKMNRM